MIIKKIIVARVKLPFLEEFSHSLRKRLWVNNIAVILLGENDKILGAGEGAPRSYVTGETSETAEKNILYLVSREDFPRSLESVEQIWRFIDALPKGKEMNASICAIEMALLDALARYETRPLIDYFSKRYFTETISYGAAIPLGNEELVKKVSERIKGLGITKIKLKMGAVYLHNRLLCEIVDRVFSEGYDMKVDVNGAWRYETGLEHLELLKRYNVRLLEQPMSMDNQDIERLSIEAKKYYIALMADESVCNIDDLTAVSRIGCYQMINIRLSKCGGIRRSLKMIDYCRKTGMKFQIGCQLGESGLLSSAGRTLCLLSNDAIYCDGSYDNLLLAQNITDMDVSFDYGGKASGLSCPGLGVNVDMDKVEMLAEGFSEIIL
jgi:L-Ala-D/L-Glu epimerase